MKNFRKTFCLCGVLLALLCVSAWATEYPLDPGIANLTVNTVSVTLYDAEDASVPAAEGSFSDKNKEEMTNFYPLAEKIEISYPDAEDGKYYAVFLLTGSGTVPTASNLQYIDQVQADSNGVTLTVYPNELCAEENYRIFLSSNATTGIQGLTEVVSFSYYDGLVYGEVDGDPEVTATDASFILQNSAGSREFTAAQEIAADVDKDEAVTAIDATYVLQYSVCNLADFALVQ